MFSETSWPREMAPKMSQALDMLEDSTIDSGVRREVLESVKHIFLVRPRSLASASGRLQVSMQDERVVDFRLDEWLQLNKRFKDLVGRSH